METKLKKILPVHLTKNEVVERGQLAADTASKIDDVQREKKRVSDDIKERLERLEGELRRLLHIVKREEEERTVECVWRFDFLRNEKNLIREDTAEVVETKAMTDEERQLALEMGNQDEPAGRPVGVA